MGGTRLVRDTLKKRVKACEEAELMQSRAHTRLGYRFGVKATSWRPGQGELVEQGRRMVPSKLAWTSSRFYGEFSKQTTAVKAEPEIPHLRCSPSPLLYSWTCRVLPRKIRPTRRPP